MRRVVEWLAAASALIGGLVLLALILMTCASIVGRAFSWLGTGPVQGDFELIELGTAFAIFAFLPLAQLKGAHAVVDLAVTALPARAQNALVAFWEVVLTVILAVILWRLFAGMEDRLRYGDTSYLLGIPLWQVYAACLVPAAVGVIVGLWVSIDRIGAVLHGEPIPETGGREP